MFEDIWFLVFLFSLFVSSLITWRTQVKGKQISFSLLCLGIGSTLARALGFFVIIYLPLINQPRISDSIFLRFIGIFLAVFGIVLLVVATRELSKTEFHGGKGIPDKVVTTGPYSVIRHPANVGFISAFAGWSLVWAAVYSLCLVPILITVLVIESFWEERNLEKVFEDEYIEYKKKVGMFLPKLRRK